MPRLCAFKCPPSNVTMHRFPNPDKFVECFRMWVALVGGKLETASDYEYYKRKRVCDKHFKDQDRNRNNRLNKLAIPLLHLPDTHGVPLHRFPNREKNPDLFAAWVSAVGEKLTGVDPKRISNKRICDHHFDPATKKPAGRLNWSAIPSINLHRVRQSISSIVQMDHSYCRPTRDCSTSRCRAISDVTNLPGCSTDQNVKQSGSGLFSANDGEAEACLEAAEAIEDIPSEISLYCSDDDSSPAEADLDNVPVVPDYRCNECREGIVGFRYTCVQCADYDLCAACEARAAHSAHYILRVPGDRPYSEIQAVLAAIRQQILSEKLFLNAIDDSFKTEIKIDPDEVPPDSDKDHLPDVNDPLPDLNDHLPEASDALPDLNDPSPELHDNFSELNAPLPDLNAVPEPDPLSELKPNSQNSHTASPEDSDSDYSPPHTPEPSTNTDDPALAISSDDSDTGGSPRAKRTRTMPFSKTYGDSIDSSCFKTLQDQPVPIPKNTTQKLGFKITLPKEDTKQVLQQILVKTPTITTEPHTKLKHTENLANSSLRRLRPETLTIVHQKIKSKDYRPVFSKPVPVQENQEKILVPIEGDLHKKLSRIFTPRVLMQRNPTKCIVTGPLQSSEDSTIRKMYYQTPFTVDVNSESSHNEPERSRKFVAHKLKPGCSRKRKLVNVNPLQSSADLTIRRTDHQRQQTIAEDESTETLQEYSEQISNESQQFCLRLPTDTNEVALLQAIQCPVTVRLQRDF